MSRLRLLLSHQYKRWSLRRTRWRNVKHVLDPSHPLRFPLERERTMTNELTRDRNAENPFDELRVWHMRATLCSTRYDVIQKHLRALKKNGG